MTVDPLPDSFALFVMDGYEDAMPLGIVFEYDYRKAASNLRKHGVSFQEAMTVFEEDPLAQTFPDDLHSEAEERYITIGVSGLHRTLFILHQEFENYIVSSAFAARNLSKYELMKNSKIASSHGPLAPRSLDLSKAVRGKYFDRVQQGTNLVVIEPDLMDAFPDADAVNRALRALKQLSKRVTLAGSKAS